MRSRSLVIFDAFGTLVTSRRGSKRTFLAGLAQAGKGRGAGGVFGEATGEAEMGGEVTNPSKNNSLAPDFGGEDF